MIGGEILVYDKKKYVPVVTFDKYDGRDFYFKDGKGYGRRLDRLNICDRDDDRFLEPIVVDDDNTYIFARIGLTSGVYPGVTKLHTTQEPLANPIIQWSPQQLVKEVLNN